MLLVTSVLDVASKSIVHALQIHVYLSEIQRKFNSDFPIGCDKSGFYGGSLNIANNY